MSIPLGILDLHPVKKQQQFALNNTKLFYSLHFSLTKLSYTKIKREEFLKNIKIQLKKTIRWYSYRTQTYMINKYVNCKIHNFAAYPQVWITKFYYNTNKKYSVTEQGLIKISPKYIYKISFLQKKIIYSIYHFTVRN